MRNLHRDYADFLKEQQKECVGGRYRKKISGKLHQNWIFYGGSLLLRSCGPRVSLGVLSIRTTVTTALDNPAMLLTRTSGDESFTRSRMQLSRQDARA